MNTAVHFAKRLGKKILHEEKELILHSVAMGGYVMALNGNPKPKTYSINECKMIFNDIKEVMDEYINPSLTVIKTDDNKYIPGETVKSQTLKQIEEDILLELCKCANVNNLQETKKNRKRELVQARQIHFAIRYLYIKKKESLAKVGEIYDMDHSTVIHAIKVVKNVKNDFDLQERFDSVFRLINKKFPEAKNDLKLDWL